MTSHHYPAAPNAVASVAFPGMWVVGDRRRMLVEDASLARSLATQVAATVADYVADWRAATGPARARERAAVWRAIAAYRRADDAARAAFGRMCREGGAAVPAAAARLYTLSDVEESVADLAMLLDQHDATEDAADRAAIAGMIADDASWLGAVVGWGR